MSNIKFDFSGSNYVVTGASSGMGRQTVIELAAAGAKVLAIARRESELKKLQTEYPDNIFIASVDVCDAIGLEHAIVHFVEENGKIDGAVHAAGIAGFSPLKMYDEELAKKIVDISFWAGIKLTQIVAKNKVTNPKASFVLFSSVQSYEAAKGVFAYACAKGALRVAVKSLAKEICKRGLRINTISPGWVRTDMTDNSEELIKMDTVIGNHLLGFGEPEEVTGTVLFLLSDRARWITGTDIVVDGGYLA